MSDWAAANIALREARDAMDETKRLEAVAVLCPTCGTPVCDSPICEVRRRKAKQQARLQIMAAQAGVGQLA